MKLCLTKINTLRQARAARINIGRDVNLVFIYNSQSRDISEKLLLRNERDQLRTENKEL